MVIFTRWLREFDGQHCEFDGRLFKLGAQHGDFARWLRAFDDQHREFDGWLFKMRAQDGDFPPPYLNCERIMTGFSQFLEGIENSLKLLRIPSSFWKFFEGFENSFKQFRIPVRNCDFL
jgi:hypothetical protein